MSDGRRRPTSVRSRHRGRAAARSVRTTPDGATGDPHQPVAPRPTGPLQRLTGDPGVFRSAWGRVPLVHRSGNDTFDDVLTLEAVDEFVSSSPRRPTIRMVADGDVLPASQYCSRIRLGGQHLDDVVDVRKVVDRLCDGATLVLQSLHRTMPAVGRFVDGLQTELSHPVQANAYLTPPRASGLAPHTDDHDVIAVQLHGQKHWTIDGLGEVELQPGDTVYVPAGTCHSASTSDDTSLHLTLGIIRVTGRDVVDRLLRGTSPLLDEPLPIGYRHPDAAPLLAERVRATLAAVAEQLLGADVEDVVESEQHRQRRRPEAPGHVTSMSIRHQLTLDGTIRWTAPEPLARTLERHDRRRRHGDSTLDPEHSEERCDERREISVHLGDRTVMFPAAATAALRRLSAGTPTRVGDLPGLDEPSRLVLARRLVEESACVIEGLGGRARVSHSLAAGTRRLRADPPPGNRDQERRQRGDDMSGEKDKATGRVKQAAGDLTDDEELQREGEADETAGKVKDAVGDAKQKVDDTVDKVKDKFK